MSSQSLARGSAQNFGASLIAAAAGFGLTLMVTRSLGTAGAGLFFVATSVTTVAASALRLGADVGLIRDLARLDSLGRAGARCPLVVHVTSVVTIGAAAAGAGLWWQAEALARLLSDQPSATAGHLRILAVVLPAIVIHQTLAIGSRGFGTMSVFNATERVARPLLQLASVGAVILFAVEFDVFGVFVAWLVAIPVVGVATVALVRRRLAAHEAQPYGDARAFWGFSIPKAAGNVLQIASARLDVIFVASLASASAAGVYAAAARLVSFTSLSHGALSSAVGPKYVRAATTGDRSALLTIFQRTTVVDMTLSWPVVTVLLLHAETLLPIFGEGYVAGTSAVRILALVMFVQAGTGTVSVLLTMNGRSDLTLLSTAVAVIASVSLSLTLIPKFGATGAAYAWGASILIDNLLPLAMVWRTTGLTPFTRTYALVAVDVLVFASVDLLVLSLVGRTPFGTGVALATGGVAYLGLVWWQGLLDDVLELVQRR